MAAKTGVRKVHTARTAVRRLFSNRTKRLNRSKSGDLVLILIIVVFGLFSLLPMVMSINQAFKPLNEIFRYPPRIFVQNPT